MSALRLESVEVVRGQGRRAVRGLTGVSLVLRPGEVLLLEGPSGSGKTTLLCTAAGLLSPVGGRVRVAGRDLGRLGRRELRRLRAMHVGFVFQRANLISRLTVRDNVRLAGFLAGVDAAETDRRTDRLLLRLGLGGLLDRRPDELSGGEEQRVAVARALVHRPTLVLADEPTGSLDSEAGGEVARSLAALAGEAGSAVLVATHDARLRSVGTRRAWIRDGRVGEVGDGTV